MRAEAEDKLPNETGGLLFGYWIERSGEVVVTAVVGPGPTAEHERGHFRPDPEYQEEELARLYAEHDRVQTYLGDWHTHPVGSSYLSREDRRTLRRIAQYEPARAPIALMGILARADDWTLSAWRWPGWRFRWHHYPKFAIRLFDQKESRR